MLHEYVFSVAMGEVQGYQLVFFALQGIAVGATLRWRPGRIVGIGVTFTINALTSVFFFASFQGLAPFYEDGLPTWLWGV